jgi:signal transduction histidine kinase
MTRKEYQDTYVSNELTSYSYVIMHNFDGNESKMKSLLGEGIEYQIYGNNKMIYQSEGYTEDSGYVYEFTYEETDFVREPLGQYTGEKYKLDSGYNSYKVKLGVDKDSTIGRKIEIKNNFWGILYDFRYLTYAVALISLATSVLCFITLMHSAGRRADKEEFVKGPLYKVPFDLLLAVCAVLGLFVTYVVDANYSGHTRYIMFVFAAVIYIIGVIMLIGLSMSAASRIKQGDFIKNTIIYRCIRIIIKVLKGCISLISYIPSVLKSVLIIAAIIFSNAVLFFSEVPELFFMLQVGIAIAALYVIVMMKRLQTGAEKLAKGELSYHTDTKGMVWDLKKHGENLNSIGAGMSIAVEDRLKSERMKTELITNVSHDIKTPITSIINYASLINDEKTENPKISEYTQVLIRQSEKLKRLVEDLVEVSKATTNNLDVLLAPCNANVFIQQASGEYEEKMKASELTMVTSVPDKEINIMADGRRMWRVFDNLMNNICKYAQPGTRVYLSLEEKEKCAEITFKNTSREALNMTEDELMERFTRGDSSRNTEGNGLGLAIAKSLAELQGGKLNVIIDGDLFKAVLRFPVIE